HCAEGSLGPGARVVTTTGRTTIGALTLNARVLHQDVEPTTTLGQHGGHAAMVFPLPHLKGNGRNLRDAMPTDLGGGLCSCGAAARSEPPGDSQLSEPTGRYQAEAAMSTGNESDRIVRCHGILPGRTDSSRWVKTIENTYW